MTQSIPPPETSRTPLSAASALAAAVEAVPPQELTLEHVHAVALEAKTIAAQARAVAQGADDRSMATESKLATIQAAMSRTEAGVNDLKRDRGDDRAFLENALGGIKSAISNREKHDAAQDEKLVDVARADEEVTKRISIAEIKLVDVDTRIGKTETWIAANPKTAGLVVGGISVTTIVGLLQQFGPAIVKHLAVGIALANGHPDPTLNPPAPPAIVAPAPAPKDQPR